MKPKVAVMLIVKASSDDEAKGLTNVLNSVKDHVDAIYIQLNAPKGIDIDPKIRNVAESFTTHISTYVWNNNFVKSRNELMKKVPKKYDWLMWLDTDDRVENPEMIIPSLSVMPENVHGVFILYDYQKDDYGNVIVAHWTTRAIRNNGVYVWKSSFDDDEVAVHETLIARRGVRQVANNEWKVVHEATTEHLRDSLARNIELLEGMALRQAKSPKGVDPRILFYIGTHNYDAYNYKEAEQMFVSYLEKSGWGEERAEAHIYMGKILLMHGKEKLAKNAFLMAIGEYADNPGAYLGVGKIEASNQRWEQASAWFRRGLDVKRKLTSMVRYNYDWELYSSYAQALAQLGGKNLSEALKMAQKAHKLRPYDPTSKENRDNILRLIDYADNMKAAARLMKKLEVDGQSDKIIPFIELLPKELEDSPLIISARQEHTTPQIWPKKSIAIYVGQGPLGIWGPWSLDEGGVGGSEEAVIRLSNELIKLGWRVTVFAMPGKKAGNYSGVEWKHYWELNNKDTFDILVCWRQPAFFDFKFKARKKYLWLHDITEKEELTPDRLNNLDKVIYVSQYHAHRPENADVPTNKQLISGNGINPADFEKNDNQFDRNPHRLIYMSANERGLRILYDIWEDVVKAVPDVILTPYYGWQSFDAVNRDNPERMAWKAIMNLRAKELGIPQSERISQDKINEEIFKSGIFAYPCVFPEVYAISFIKAVAGGAQAVTSDFACLSAYDAFSTQVHLGDDFDKFKEEYKKALIHALKHPLPDKERHNLAKLVRNSYSWSAVARQWNEEMK